MARDHPAAWWAAHRWERDSRAEGRTAVWQALVRGRTWVAAGGAAVVCRQALAAACRQAWAGRRAWEGWEEDGRLASGASSGEEAWAWAWVPSKASSEEEAWACTWAGVAWAAALACRPAWAGEDASVGAVACMTASSGVGVACRLASWVEEACTGGHRGSRWSRA